jgi:transposase
VGRRGATGRGLHHAPGRGRQHAEWKLQGFNGILLVDGYARYNRLIAPDRIGQGINLAHCWAHARHKLIEITRTGPAPIAEEGVALAKIAKYRDGLDRFRSDGRVDIDSNFFENAIRSPAINRRNALFAGHDEGGHN